MKWTKTEKANSKTSSKTLGKKLKDKRELKTKSDKPRSKNKLRKLFKYKGLWKRTRDK